MHRILLASTLILIPFFAKAQYLTGIATRYNDSFVEWNFYTDLEEEEGELRLRWDNDWSEWDYRLEDNSGSIKLKWKDNPGEWELRGNNRIVSARILWNNDFTEWRITDNSISLTLASKWKNLFDEWKIRESSHGNFEMYTNWERDPRDWTIIDELDDEVSYEMRMMLMFIVVFHSSPRQ